MSCFVDVIRPSKRPLAITYDCLCLIAASLFLTLMSKLAIPLWFTPVPITMQTFAVLLIGALLGSKRGALAVSLYLVEGMMGLPVFAPGTLSLIGPDGGYLIGFVLCAYLVGFLLERGWKEDYKLTLLALALGSLTILTVGFLWLAVVIGYSNAFFMGVYPFLIGDSIKLLAASVLIPSSWKLIQCLNK